MAQTGYTPILIYSSTTASQAPSAGNLTNSTLGSELAINITDGKLFYKDNANAVQVIGWKTTPTTAGGTGLTSYTAGDLLYYASGTTLSKLAIGTSGQWLGSSGTAPQWNSPAALTKTDDTNVTLTLGGSASTALLNAASLTLGWTGQLAVTRGGTGLASVAQGDILYGSAANTLSALAKNTTATRYLSNTGASNNPAWAQVDLTNGVTGTLPIGNGGTGQTSFPAGYLHYGSFSTSSNLFWDATNNRLGINTTTPSDIIGLGGNTDHAIVVERVTIAGTSGSWLQLKAGGAYSGGTNLNGGDIFLYTGTSTGSGSANMRFFTATAGASGTADRAPTEKMRIWGSGGVSIGNTTDPGASNLSVTGNILGGTGKSFIANGNRTYYQAVGWYDDGIQGNGAGCGAVGGLTMGPLNGSGAGSDNTITLGNATYRWKTVYAGDGTINTSDGAAKQDITNLEDAELRVAKRIKSLIKKFRFIDAVSQKGDAARIHVGVVAQEIQSAFTDEGLDANRYGLFCQDDWYEVDGVAVDENFKAYTAKTPNAIKRTRLGIRYEQLVCFVLSAI